MARKGQGPAVCKIENCNIPLYKYHDETLNVKSENNCFKSVIGEHLECSGEDIPSSMTFLNYLHALNYGYYIDFCAMIYTFKNQFSMSQVSI